MKALILAAGFGTRLNTVGENTAKAFLEMKGRPVIDYIFDNLRNVKEIDEIILTTNNKFYNDFVKWKTNRNLNVKIINNGVNHKENKLGAIGDIYFVLKNTKINDDLLVIGSDNLFDFQLQSFVNEFLNKKSSMIAVRHEIPERRHLFGNVLFNSDMKVLEFVEKPENPKSSFAASCIYLYPKEVLGLFNEYMKEEVNHDQPGRFVSYLLKEKKIVHAYKLEGRWFDIGNLETLKEAMESYS